MENHGLIIIFIITHILGTKSNGYGCCVHKDFMSLEDIPLPLGGVGDGLNVIGGVRTCTRLHGIDNRKTRLPWR